MNSVITTQYSKYKQAAHITTPHLPCTWATQGHDNHTQRREPFAILTCFALAKRAARATSASPTTLARMLDARTGTALTWHHPANANASVVFPTPDGPHSSTPRGGTIPSVLHSPDRVKHSSARTCHPTHTNRGPTTIVRRQAHVRALRGPPCRCAAYLACSQP